LIENNVRERGPKRAYIPGSNLNLSSLGKIESGGKVTISSPKKIDLIGEKALRLAPKRGTFPVAARELVAGK